MNEQITIGEKEYIRSLPVVQEARETGERLRDAVQNYKKRFLHTHTKKS